MIEIKRWIGGVAVAVVINFAFWPIILRFIKIGEMRLPYLASVILLTTACGALIGRRYRRKVVYMYVSSIAAGLVSSFVALQIAKLFDRFGPLAAFRSVDNHSIMEAWIVDAALTILLGGWLACFASSLIFSRGRNKSTPADRQSTEFDE